MSANILHPNIMCLCGYYNHDGHLGGQCPTNKSRLGELVGQDIIGYWFKEIDSKKPLSEQIREPFYVNQSHGGHGWIPCCNENHQFL
jgi:hypothetical protein